MGGFVAGFIADVWGPEVCSPEKGRKEARKGRRHISNELKHGFQDQKATFELLDTSADSAAAVAVAAFSVSYGV